jgi:O-methyltransferase involved in polyketide biosynthesis
MSDEPTPAPDSTAVRTALWRAMHVQIDPPPHVLEDTVGLELLEAEDRAMAEWAKKGAAASGTPFATLFSPTEMLALARDAGFKAVQHVPGTSHTARYFANRTDGLRPSSGEDLLLATT